MSQNIVIGVAVVGLLALALVFLVLRDRDAARRRVYALFRRSPRPPQAPGPGHYYKPYWS
jgi:hypothetical protein